jgi:peptidyl-prolyl cis-trans isomerase C
MAIARLLPGEISVVLNRLCIALMIALAALPARAQEVGIAAKVNGGNISIFRLERYFEDYLKEKSRNVATIRNPSAYKRLKRDALERLIDRELLAQEASRRAINITAAELADACKLVVAGYKTPEAYRRRLGEAGFTDATFDDYLRQDLMAQRALAELTVEANPNDAEVRQAYSENRERYVLPERIRARQILLRVASGATEQEREAVRLRLLELSQRIHNGADFAGIAEQYSEDSSHHNGGDLGYFARGKMVPDFDAVAFALQVGELSDPVQSPYGWHLVRVEDRQLSRAIAEDEALALVRRQLAVNRRGEVERRTLLELRKSARVEILLPLQ